MAKDYQSIGRAYIKSKSSKRSTTLDPYDEEGFQKYDDLENNSDYQEFSNALNPSAYKTWTETPNMTSGQIGVAQLREALSGTTRSRAEQTYEGMTDSQKAHANYLSNTDQGSYKQMMKDYEIPVAQKVYQEANDTVRRLRTSDAYMSSSATEEEAQKKADTAKALMQVTTALSNSSAGTPAFLEQASSVARLGMVNPYGNGNNLQVANEAIRGATSEELSEKYDYNLLGQNIPSFLYETGMSMADMVTGANLYGKGYTAQMGLGASASRARELMNQGESNTTKLIASSIASGMAEAAFEYLPLENYLKMKNPSSEIMLAKNVLKQMTSEMIEESGTELTNAFTDTLIRGETSDFVQNIHRYEEEGAEHPILKALADIGVQTAWAGAGGALSGGGIGFIGSAQGYMKNRSVGKALQKADMSDTVLEKATELSTQDGYETTAETLKDVTRNGDDADKMRPVQVGALATSVESDRADFVNRYINEYSKYGAQDLQMLLDTEKEHLSFLESGESKVKKSKVEASIEKSRSKIDAIGKALEAKKERPFLADLMEGENAKRIRELSEQVDESRRENFLENARDEISAESYKSAYDLVYEYASTGRSLEDVVSKFEGSNLLNEGQVANIYSFAQKNSISERTTLFQNLVDSNLDAFSRKGEIYEGDFEKDGIRYKGIKGTAIKDESTKRRYIALNTVFKKLGVNVQWYASTEEQRIGDDAVANGMFKPSNNTIYLDINAGNGEDIGKAVVSVASHELTHWMELKSPKLYMEYADSVLQALSKNDAFRDSVMKHFEGNTNVMDAITALQIGELTLAKDFKNANMMGALNEIVAKASEDHLANSEFVMDLLTGLSEKSRKTVTDKIRELVGKIKKLYFDVMREFGSESAEAKAIRSMKDEAERLQKMWDKMLKDAVVRNDEASAYASAMKKAGKESSAPVESDTQNALRAMFTAMQMEFNLEDGIIRVVADDGTVYDRDHHLTEEAVKRTQFGSVILCAEVSKESKDQQITFITDFFNQILDTNDPELIYAVDNVYGYQPYQKYERKYDDSANNYNKFAPMTGNSDPQYSKTIDFTTICLKTKAIIDVMSETMKRTGKGLTQEQIIEIVYNEVYESGEPVPCPVCYVFSRWVGLGGLLDTMNNLQNQYKDADAEELRTELDRLTAEIEKRAEELEKEGVNKPKDKAKNEKLKQFTPEFNELDRIYKTDLMNGTKTMTKEQMKRYRDLKKFMDMVDKKSWFEMVRLQDDFEPIPTDVLFDINAGREFATRYPNAWKYRTTRGSGMGKSANPYTDANLGQILVGLSTGKDSKAFKALGDLKKSPFLFSPKAGNPVHGATLSKTAKNIIAKARLNARIQNLLNGMRFQSTSDFRPEYVLDYLMAHIELQAAGSKVQLYTKVPESVRFLASMNDEVNCSLMPLGDGYTIDKDGNIILQFSNVTGMNPEDAFALSREFDNVQPILVVVNDTHFLAAMNDDRITFIIPYHSSGNTNERYASMMKTVGEDVPGRDDYTDYQRDVEKSDATPEQKLVREARMKILTGKKSEITKAEMDIIKGNRFLSNLYNRFFVDKKSDAYGLSLSKESAEMIMPHEYWDKTTTIETADKNSELFAEYCESLGIIPRFSGWAKGAKYEQSKDFLHDENGNIRHGYWKTLIDRSMYNNDGTYHEQLPVDITGLNADLLDSKKSRDAVIQPSQQNTPAKVSEITDRVIKRINGETVQRSSRNATPENLAIDFAEVMMDVNSISEKELGKTIDGITSDISSGKIDGYVSALESLLKTTSKKPDRSRIEDLITNMKVARDEISIAKESKKTAKAMADQFAGKVQNSPRMRILVACEESQAIATRLRLNGHEAYSCDVKECSGGHPEYHIQGDVLSLLNGNAKFRTQSGLKGKIDGKWDMIIAHPPCTHLAISGAKHFEAKRADGRQREAIEFFCQFLNADCDRIAIENPVGIISGDYIKKWYPDLCEKYGLPRKSSQTIQPYQFGDPFEKKTHLWLKGISPLQHTNVVEPEPRVTYPSGKTMAAWYANATGDRSEVRSKTFNGIADAVSDQWVGKADDVDSDGRPLTEEQVKFFAESKVRDGAGKLLKLYHGTGEKFQEFRSDKAIWVTSDIGWAEHMADAESSYGGEPVVMELYANIENPVNLGNIDGDISTKWVDSFLKKNGITDKTAQSKIRKLANSGMYDYVYQMTESPKFISIMKSLGYDGMFAKEYVSDTFCAFSQTQVKEVGNNSSHSDAQYSRRKDRNNDYIDSIMGQVREDDSFGRTESFITTWDGVKIPILEQNLFSNRKIKDDYLSVTYAVNLALKELTGQKVTIKSSNQTVTFDGTFASEYINSNYSAHVASTEDRRVKTNAISGIVDMVENATNPISESNIKQNKGIGTPRDASGGITSYTVYVAIPGGNDFDIYMGRLTVRTDKNGDSYPYEVTKIKKIGNPTSKSYKTRTPYANISQSSVAGNMKITSVISLGSKFGHQSARRTIRTVADADKEGREKLRAYKEQMKKKQQIESIRSMAKEMTKKFSENSGKRHVPIPLQAPLYDILTHIDYMSFRYSYLGEEPTKSEKEMTDMLTKLANSMDNYKEHYAKDDAEAYLDMPPDFVQYVREVTENMKDIRRKMGDDKYVLDTMSSKDLEDVVTMFRVLRSFVNNTNRMLSDEISTSSKRYVSDLSHETQANLLPLGEHRQHGKTATSVANAITWKNALPYYAFKRMRGGEIFRSFMDGQDKCSDDVEFIKDFTRNLYSPSDVDEWIGEVHEFDILQPISDEERSLGAKAEAKHIKMTTAQIMSLYCLNKRLQAGQHMFDKGIKIGQTDAIKGKQEDAILISKEDVAQITSKLSEEQIRVADALQSFLSNEMSEWGNEVTMKRWGIKCFTEQFYFPIKSDSSQLTSDSYGAKGTSMYRLLNMSFTKSLNEYANNTIVIDDIFTVFASHTSDMAKYHTLALPLLDAIKWYNYKDSAEIVSSGTDGEKRVQHRMSGVKQALVKAFGSGANEYFELFLGNLNGEYDRGTLDDIIKPMMSRSKMASVAANTRVALLQGTAYLRASAVISNKSLIKGLSGTAHWKENVKDAFENNGIARWKAMGFYDMNISRGVEEQIRNDATVMDKIMEKSMYLAELGDKATWGLLWKACDYEIRDTTNLKPGTEKFLEAKKNLFRETIYRTQVVDSVLTRTGLMRDKNVIVQQATAFMSEPSVTYNMLQDAFLEWADDARRYGEGGFSKTINKHGKKFRRVMFAHIMTSVAAATVEGAVDRIRHKDDEDDTYMKEFLDNLFQDLSIVGKLPYLKDLANAITAVIGKGIKKLTDWDNPVSNYLADRKFFEPDRMEMEWIVQTYNAGNAVVNMIEDSEISYKEMYKVLRAISVISGKPVGNLAREIKSIPDGISIAIDMWNETVAEAYPSLYIG